ncbi:MAG TPA: hypothetical protein VHZ04_03580 [Candidatus Paceibacterota bacterium]|nr:hypothetical protein [Candidatus Paceibacterota bacterium]
MMAKTDPPIVTKGNLAAKSVSLLTRVFDETMSTAAGEPKGELMFSEPQHVPCYWPFSFPFWLDWDWEMTSQGGFNGETIALALSDRARLQIDYLSRSAPKLVKHGHVISAALWMFRLFQEYAEEGRDLAIFRRAVGNLDKVSFPFWQSEM